MGVPRCGQIAPAADRKTRRRNLRDNPNASLHHPATTQAPRSSTNLGAAAAAVAEADPRAAMSLSSSSPIFSLPSPNPTCNSNVVVVDDDGDYDISYPSLHHQCRCPPLPYFHDNVEDAGIAGSSSSSQPQSSDSSSRYPGSPECRVGCWEEEEDDDGVDRAGDSRARCLGGGGRGYRKVSASSSSQCLVWPCLARASLMFLVLMSCLGVNLARPTRSRSSVENYRNMQNHAVKYLAQFGYLTGPSRETGNLMTEESLNKAVKELQRMGHIPQTGVLDTRTVKLMSKPRCGNLDTTMGVIPGHGREDLGQRDAWSRGSRRSKRYITSPSKWDKNNLTFRLLNYTPDLEISKVRESIWDAFYVWSNNTWFTFTEQEHGEADIMIKFAKRYHRDGYPFDGKGLTLAHAFFPGKGNGGDTHFDEDELWTLNDTSGVDLFIVAAHEFGHALGLAHSTEPEALMYPWYQGFTSGQFVLPTDDIRGIQKLYGLPNGQRDFLDKPTVPLDPTVNNGGGGDRSDPRGRDGYDVNPDGDDTAPPDPCTTPFDAITIIRTEMFVFIGKWFWRMSSRNITRDPIHIHKFWYGLPRSVKKIDAAFERHRDKRIIFFSGDRYWIYNANSLVTGFPAEGRPITEFGIPADVDHIDAVFTWGFNRRTYLVSGDMYWKLDENNTYVEYDYPRDMAIWRGVPIPLDAAFQYKDGKTYFFQDRSYWKYYDVRMQVDPHYPRSIAQDWLACTGSQTQSVHQPGSQRQGSYIHKDQPKDSVELVDSQEEIKRIKELLKDSGAPPQAFTAQWLCWLSLLITFFIGQGWRVE